MQVSKPYMDPIGISYIFVVGDPKLRPYLQLATVFDHDH